MAKGRYRDKGDGSLYRRHLPECPAAVPTEQPDGTTKRERPKHACRGLWVARVELEGSEDGKRRYTQVARKDYAAAVKALRELRAQKDQHGDIPTGGMTLETWLWKWHKDVVSVNEAPSTVKSYRSIIKTQLVPILGTRRLDKLAPEHIRLLHETLRKRTTRRGTPLAESSIRKAHNVLSSALSQALEDGKVRRNVAGVGKKPQAKAKHQGAYTNEEVQQFLRANAKQPNFARLATAFYTGERQGEVIGLEDSRLLNLNDPEQASALVTHQLQRIGFRHGCDGTCSKKRAGSCPQRELDIRPGLRDEIAQLEGGLCLSPVKSASGERVIPLHPALVAILLRHMETRPPNPHGLVFSRPDGRPLDPRDDLVDWKAALARAGLEEKGTHVARRTAATEMRRSGTDRKVMREALGHASDRSTDVYLGRDLELARVAMQAVGDGYAPSGD